jgi:hypothetical protein
MIFWKKHAARQELKGYIDIIPERSFNVVRDFLLYNIAETPLVIEQADAEETAMIEEAMREYENDPSAFTPWKTVKKEMGLV